MKQHDKFGRPTTQVLAFSTSIPEAGDVVGAD